MFKAYFARERTAAARERRIGARVRTRLRPGKLLDRDLAFLADCAILDRTAKGMRVRCFGELRHAADEISVFDEKDGTVRAGRLVWRRAGEFGIRFEDAARASVDPKILRELSAPYYAVTD